MLEITCTCNTCAGKGIAQDISLEINHGDLMENIKELGVKDCFDTRELMEYLANGTHECPICECKDWSVVKWN